MCNDYETIHNQGDTMAKGQDAKKTVKKPATKTLKEKRNDKKAKS
jgi:hypothetical protein